MTVVWIALDAVRTSIGLVFLLSVLSKARDVRGFLRGAVEYQILPTPLAIGYGLLVIPLEGWLLAASSAVDGWPSGRSSVYACWPVSSLRSPLICGAGAPSLATVLGR